MGLPEGEQVGQHARHSGIVSPEYLSLGWFGHDSTGSSQIRNVDSTIYVELKKSISGFNRK
jgi:hypothetical protein